MIFKLPVLWKYIPYQGQTIKKLPAWIWPTLPLSRRDPVRLSQASPAGQPELFRLRPASSPAGLSSRSSSSTELSASWRAVCSAPLTIPTMSAARRGVKTGRPPVSGSHLQTTRSPPPLYRWPPSTDQLRPVTGKECLQILHYLINSLKRDYLKSSLQTTNKTKSNYLNILFPDPEKKWKNN